jgi:quinate dehydrogenase (quinone)
MQHQHPTQPMAVRVWLWVLGAVLAVAGLFFLVGGGKLITLGGSWYFLLAGIGLLASGLQLLRHRPSGVWIYLATFAATVVWAVSEVGFDYWSLVSRLLAMTFGAAVIAASLPLMGKDNGERMASKGPFAVAGVLLVAGIAGFVSMFNIHPEVKAQQAAATPKAVTP